MADDRDARIAQLEAEIAALREREAVLVSQAEQRDRALTAALEQRTAQLARSVDELRALGVVSEAVSSSLDIRAAPHPARRPVAPGAGSARGHA